MGIGSAPGLDDFVGRTYITATAGPTSPVDFSAAVPLATQPPDGAFVFICVWRVPASGIEFPGRDLFACSSGLVVDLSAPVYVSSFGGPVVHSFPPGTSQAAGVAAGDVVVPLQGFVELQSRVTGFDVVLHVSTEAGGGGTSVTHGPISVSGNAVHAVFSSVQLSDGDHLTADVTATNAVSLTLAKTLLGGPISVGSVLPGAVNDGPTSGPDQEWFVTPGSAAVWWEAFSSPTSVTYEVALGTAPGLSDLSGGFLQSGTGGADTSLIVPIVVAVATGTRVFATVRGTNVGLDVATAASDGAVLDDVALATLFFNIASTTAPVEELFITGGVGFINWAFNSPVSGIAACTIAYTVQTATIEGPFVVTVTGDGSAGITRGDTSPSLPDGAAVVATLDCASNAGWTMTATTSTTIFDSSPPSPGVVVNAALGFAGPPASHPSNVAIDASWLAFVDAHTAITQYSLCYGVVRGTCDASDVVSTGTSLSGSATLSVPDGTVVYATVVATNAATLSAASTSAGVLVDGTPPDASGAQVLNTLDLTEGGTVQHDSIFVSWVRSPVSCAWRLPGFAVAHSPQLLCVQAGFEDVHTGVVAYDVEVTDSAGAVFLSWLGVAGTQVSEVSPSPPVLEGEVYTISVVARNGANGASTPITTTHVRDSTPPVAGMVRDGPTAGVDIDFQTAALVSVTWDAFTAHTPAEYTLEVCETVAIPETCVFETPTGLDTQFSGTGLPLESGVSYFARIVGTGASGLTAQASSDGACDSQRFARVCQHESYLPSRRA